MPNKGIVGAYESCCSGRKFYDWKPQGGSGIPEILCGQICEAPIFYKTDEILTLEEANFDPIVEERSTFFISRLSAGPGRRFPHRPYKTFQLEGDDDLMLLKCKKRPTVVIKEINCDWRFPRNRVSNLWLCLPIFSYRDRHDQSYVIEDQKLAIPNRFYFPPGLPGLDHEGAGLLNELQFIPKRNLAPYKSFCDELDGGMDRPVMLSKDALSIVVGHISKLFPGIEITGDSIIWYEYFKELANIEIAEALRGISH